MLVANAEKMRIYIKRIEKINGRFFFSDRKKDIITTAPIIEKVKIKRKISSSAKYDNTKLVDCAILLFFLI